MEEVNIRLVVDRILDDPEKRREFYKTLVKKLVDDPDFVNFLAQWLKEFRSDTIALSLTLIDVREMVRVEVEKVARPMVEQVVRSLDVEQLKKIVADIYNYTIAKAVADVLRDNKEYTQFLKELIIQTASYQTFIEKLATEIAQYTARSTLIRDAIISEIIPTIVEKIKSDEKLKWEIAYNIIGKIQKQKEFVDAIARGIAEMIVKMLRRDAEAQRRIYENVIAELDTRSIAKQVTSNVYDLETIIRKRLVSDETFLRELYEQIKPKLLENAEYYANQLGEVLYNILKGMLKNDTALHAQMYQKIVRELERRLKQ